MTRRYIGWRKSRHSAPDAGCVEVGRADNGTIGVRDTKQHGTGHTLELTPTQWATLVHKIRTQQLDT
ncbi:DUF397 domain-containing protein [Actinomadura miaoliensis]|uniref:DUF397 domain-containing protein n=1 Tax=Actinomadura miaoliensis TaxID=430685 RepID=A0ABP7VWM2_9ACTN